MSDDISGCDLDFRESWNLDDEIDSLVLDQEQLLHLQNGDFLTRKVYAGDNRLAQLLKSEPDNGKVLDELYLGTLSRLPTDAERTVVTDALKTTEREMLFRDLLWALLNTKEFAFNH